MLKFNKSLTLDKKVAVIVPTGLSYSMEMEKTFVRFFSDNFGGATTMNIKGAYTMNNGEIEYDNGIYIYAWYSEMTDDQADTFVSLVEKAKELLHQECIGVEYDNKFTLVF